MPNGLTEQKRLSVYNRNPGPRRGKGGAIEKHFAVKWHIVTLKESIEYLEHEFLTNRFHVTHYGGCAILFNQDTFCSDIKVTSVHLHDLRCSQQDTVKEGESGWCYKVSYQGHLFAGSHAVANRSSQCCRCTSTKALHREEATTNFPRCDD